MAGGVEGWFLGWPAPLRFRLASKLSWGVDPGRTVSPAKPFCSDWLRLAEEPHNSTLEKSVVGVGRFSKSTPQHLV